MKFNKFKIVFLLSLFTTGALAQNAVDANNALGGSSWGDQYNSADNGTTTVGSSTEVVVTSSQVAKQSCEKKDQNSIPDKFFFNLLAGKKWDISHDSNSGLLNIDGGMMVSNCNSMLRYNFSQSQDGRPYLFQAEIRKPANCNNGKCKYSVAVAGDSENPNIKTGDIDIEVEPNFYGFVECLEKTGVLKDGKMQGGKVVAAPFKYEQNGLYATDEVAYYCHGPACRQMKARYGEVEAKGGSCDYFSKMTPTGYTFYSQEDVEKNRKQNLFDKICKAGSYKLIDSHLPEFTQMKSLYSILREVRNNLLLDEVKALHKELEAKDYSSLDAGKYRDTLNDFYIKIIKPIQGKIANLQKNPGKNQERINELTKLLIKYAKDPYLTDGDYANMKSFIKKAPLKQEAWRQAAISLYSIQNTAYHYSRFNSDVRASNTDMEVESIGTTNALIETDVSSQREYVKKLGELDADPKKSFAADYAKNGNDIIKSKATNAQDLYRYKQEEQQYMYNHCLNPRKYWINRNKCVQGVQQNIAYAEQDAIMYNRGQDIAAQQQYALANQWAILEGQRNGRAPVAINQSISQPQQFTFNNPGYTSNGQFNPYLQNRNPAGTGYWGSKPGFPPAYFNGPQQPSLSTPGFNGGYTGGGFTGYPQQQGGGYNQFQFTPGYN